MALESGTVEVLGFGMQFDDQEMMLDRLALDVEVA